MRRTGLVPAWAFAAAATLAAAAVTALLASPAAAQRGAPAHPATGAPPAPWPAYVSAFDSYVRADSIVGAATLVMHDGRVLAHHEIGFADRALGQRVDTNTIFHWGSITKTLTAIAVMQMVERRRLSLEARVTDYIPELRRVHDEWGSMDSVTVQMLLSHASGLQNGTWPWTKGLPWEPFEPTTWEQLVAMMPYQEVAFKPGSRYSYSNPGFIYLARIVQQLTGDPWEAYVQKNIFTPLGLTRSYFNATPWHLAEHRSNNYYVERDSASRLVRVKANGREFDPGITVPNGGWNAPLADLATYLAFLTNSTGDRGPTTENPAERRRLYETVLPHATLERMWVPRYPTTPADSAGEWEATSFFVYRKGDATIVGHTGSQAGFRAFFYWNPATKDAVIAAFNTSNEVDAHASMRGEFALRDLAWAMLR
ncbi:MAG: serine hydrolase domain-containing protein [Gemmatimonadales bacterium]